MSYRKCISVSLEHRYFADLRCPAVTFEVAPHCRSTMRRRRQHFYPTPGGFHIFKSGESTDSGKEQETDDVYDIAVYPADSRFGNYSNLDIDYRGGSVYYIGSRLKTGPADGTEKRITMTAGKTSHITFDTTSDMTQAEAQVEAVPVLLRPMQFVIPLEPAETGDTFQLLDSFGHMAEQQRIGDKVSGAALFADLSRKTPGLYTLRRNQTDVAWFYADDTLHRKKPAFIISVDAASSHYNIRIANRPVSWEYHVIARSNGRKLNNLHIRNNNDKLASLVNFEQVRVHQQRMEVVFVSSHPVPLSEKAFQSIELIEKGANGAPLVPHLANADIASLHVRDGKWVARIYVYI